MKSIQLLFAACTLMVGMLISTTTQAQVNEGQAIGQATAAASSCITPFQASYDIISSFATINCVTEPCPHAYSVSFYANRKCPGNQICPLAPSIQIAEVFFDADGNIVLINCYNQ